MSSRIKTGIRLILEKAHKREEIRPHYEDLAQLSVTLDHLKETDPLFVKKIEEFKADKGDTE